MTNPKTNLSRGEQKTMEELGKRKYIIITNADKGGAVVKMDVEKYINEANHQLSNKPNYKQAQEELTLQHSNMVNDTTDRFKKENLLSKNLADGLKSVNPELQSFTFHPRSIRKTTQEGQ